MKNQSVTVESKTRVPSSILPVDPTKVFHSIVDALFAIDPRGIIHFVSPACLGLLGYRVEEMLGASVLDFIHPEDIERTLMTIAHRTHDCGTSNFENRCVKKDGSTVYLTWSGRWDANDNLFYCVARNGAEKRVMEDRLYKAQQIARVASYEFDITDNCYTYVSETIFDIFGLNKNQHPTFTPELFWSCVHPEDVQLVCKSVQHPKHFLSSMLEYRIIRPNGEVAYINRMREVVRDRNGKPLKNIGMLQDITERKIGELALKQSEERFRSLAQNCGDMIGIVDIQGNYRFVSDNVKTHLGYDAEELVGKNAFGFIHPEDVSWVSKVLGEVKGNEAVTVPAFRFLNGKSEWRWIEVTVTNHLDNPSIGGMVINSRDVTEKKTERPGG